MWCTRCLRSTALRRQLPLARHFSLSTSPLRTPEPQLSTPVTAPGEQQPKAPAASSSSKSICPEGTVLTGLNYLKGGQDPVALKDDDYPPWLWDCLEVKKKSDEDADDNAGDEFCTFLPHE